MQWSIIIPAFNDPHLTDCLHSLQRLEYAASEYEVIVVDNHPTPTLQGLVAQFGYHYIHEPETGSYRARNAGLIAAQGTYVAFTDSDCEVAADWLHAFDSVLSNQNVAAGFGLAKGIPGNRIAEYEQHMYEANIAQFTKPADLQRIDTRNFAIKRAVYQRSGGFTPQFRFGGDMEYGARLHAAGQTIRYVPAAVVWHHNAEQLRPLLQKRLQQNYGNMFTTQLHDKPFVVCYFPHLLRYRRSPLTWILWWSLRCLAWLHFPFSDIIVRALPYGLGYRYFKLVNILAMRLGQLSFIWR